MRNLQLYKSFDESIVDTNLAETETGSKNERLRHQIVHSSLPTGKLAELKDAILMQN